MITKDDDLTVNEDEIEVGGIEEQVEEEVVESTDTPDQAEEEDPESIQDEDEEDRIVTIGDSPAEDSEGAEDGEDDRKDLVKKLRKVTRGLEKKNKALKRQIEANERATETKPVELGEKPTLKGCGYDDAKFSQELAAYLDTERKVKAQEAEKAKAIEEEQKAWQSKRQVYEDLKQEHKFKDFDDAEELVVDTFSQAQQSIIVAGADDPALLVYALGKNPKKLEELSKITNTVEFAVKIGKLESQLKVTDRKPPKPETRLKTGKAGGSGNVDKKLEQLEAKAARTGDRTEVVAYKRKLRDKG